MDTNTDVVAIRDKFIALQNELNTEIFERNQEIHGAVLALLARQHHFQLGTPGVAKSLLVERIVQRIDGLGTDGYFRWLLTRYTTPEELFGGPDFNLLRDAGIYKRITERKLPRAYLYFGDEIFKGNSSILNATLTALNERKFFNHDDNENIPLISAFTASNEMPQGDELEALWDRLLLRYILKPMRESSSFVKMLATKMVAHPEKVLSLDDLHTAHRMVDDVVIPQSVFDAMKSLRSSLSDENIDPSPRRWVDSLDVIRAEAFMNGHDVAEIVDLRPLMHIMWSEPGQIRNVQRAVLELADPIDRQATGIIEVLDELDAEMRTAIKDAVGKELARTSVEVHRRLRRIDEELKNLKTEQATLDRESEVLTEALDKFKVLVKLLVNDGFKLSEMDI